MLNFYPSYESFSQNVSREDLDKIAEVCLNLRSLTLFGETQTRVSRISWEDYFHIFVRLFKDGAQFLERGYQQDVIKHLISEQEKVSLTLKQPNVKEIEAKYLKLLEWLNSLCQAPVSFLDPATASINKSLFLFLVAYEFSKIEFFVEPGNIGKKLKKLSAVFFEKEDIDTKLYISHIQGYIAEAFIENEDNLRNRLTCHADQSVNAKKRNRDDESNNEIEKFVSKQAHALRNAVSNGKVAEAAAILGNIRVTQIIIEDGARSFLIICERKDEAMLKLFMMHPIVGAIIRIAALGLAAQEADANKFKVLLSKFALSEKVAFDLLLNALDKDGDEIASLFWEHSRTPINVERFITYVNQSPIIAEARLEKFKRISKNPQVVLEDTMLQEDEMDLMVKQFLGLELNGNNNNDSEIYDLVTETIISAHAKRYAPSYDESIRVNSDSHAQPDQMEEDPPLGCTPSSPK